MVNLDIRFGLYAKLRGIDNKQAFKELLEKQCFDVNRSNYTIDTNNEIADIERRDTVYRAFLNELKLSVEHRRLLLDYGFPQAYINSHNFKSVPKKPKNVKETIKRKMLMHYMKNYDLSGIPGYFQREDFSWDFTSADGFLIPVLDVDNKMQGIIIELDKEYHRRKACMV